MNGNPDSTRTMGSPAAAPSPVASMATRTRMLLAAPILPTLLRLSFPNVLNLLALAGMITFGGLLRPDSRIALLRIDQARRAADRSERFDPGESRE